MTWLQPDLGASVCTVVTDRFSPPGGGDFNLAWHAGDAAHVAQNRDQVRSALGARDIQWLQQVHGTDVHYVDSVDRKDPVGDALWTNRAGVGLAIMTADCVPILLATERGDAVGAAHAGWQGLEKRVLTQLVRAMPQGPLRAWIGPAISQRNYEVGEEVWSRFPEAFSIRSQGDAGCADKRYLDLPGLALQELSELGVKAVAQSGICVFADDAYYSHRASQSQGRIEGRFVTAIAIRAQ